MTARRAGVLWVLASATSYSMFGVFGKWVLRDLRPTDVLVWRFAFAAPLAWVMVAVRRTRGGVGARGAPAPAFGAAGALFGVVALLAFSALDHLSAALYTVVIYTYPALVAMGSALLGRRPPPRLWVAVGVTMLGIALTVPRVFDDPHADGIGIVLTLANAVAYAAYILGTSRFIGSGAASHADGLVASAWSFTGSLAFSVVVGAVVGVHLPHGPRAWWSLAGLAVVSTVVAGVTFLVGLGKLGPAPAALVATAEPVMALVWAMTILGESLVAVQFVGAALVLGGVLWAQRANPVAALDPG